VKTARNVAIILALAGVLYAVPSSARVADFVLWLLFLGFMGTLAWFAARTYREYRPQLLGLEDRRRATLYGSIGLVVVAVTATARLWDTGPGILAWFAMVVIAVLGAYSVYQAHSEY